MKRSLMICTANPVFFELSHGDKLGGRGMPYVFWRGKERRIQGFGGKS
jgi:hypothetical protein